jgi:hypothetical protein
VKTLDDLRGNTVSLPRDAREHCRLFFERSCVPAGTTATSFYRKIQRPAEGSDALEEVASGKAQIAIVDALTFEKFRQERPTRAGLVQVVFQSDPFPPGVIAYDRKPAHRPGAGASISARPAVVAGAEAGRVRGRSGRVCATAGSNPHRLPDGSGALTPVSASGSTG